MVNVPKWKKWTIGELISQTKTTIQTGPFGTVLSASEFVDYGIPVISVREIREGFIRVTDETPCVTDETFSRLGKYTLSANDIVFARKGSVDRSAVIPDGAERYFLGSDGIRIRFDERVVNPNLMLYIFQSPSTKQFLIQSSYGTTMAGLNEKILSALEFYLPETMKEQNRIVQVLTDIDKQLTLTEEMIAKKRAIKQGTMQELLTGKKRLPGFDAPKSTVKLSDVAIIKDGTHGTYSRVSNGTLLLSAKNIFNNHMEITENESMISTDDYLSIMSNGFPRCGDVLLSCVGTIGRCCIYSGKPKAAFQRSVAFIRSKGINTEYLLYLLQSDETQKQLKESANASAQGGVYLGALANLKIEMVNDPDEQSAIASVLTSMDNEIRALEQKLEKYRQVKQSMIQQLLTGKIKLV